MHESSSLTPLVTRLLAVGIAGSGLLPLAPDGSSFWDLLVVAFTQGALIGLITLLGFGSPYLFAFGVVCMGARSGAPSLHSLWVTIPVSLMHAQLVLTALALLHQPVVAAAPLLGFALVSASYFVFHAARVRAAGDGDRGPSELFYLRWGAMMIVAMGGWMRLQRLAGIEFGIAVDVALGCALLLSFVLGRSTTARTETHE